ncbi:hypothetical protein [Yersinia sp. Marseille-Q3913]|uniref:hypothetical protein n=1 Tax=Yersinia sp. Marseille-Q3913 TaxID=2830769 RepID=UPI001BB069E7|nr:hypothetical protein [Yersinia sp. Marseille-Q3913]MBS0055582.1 hypothetical protein [Yersinia sp. Marseille-Q3913]
MRNNEKISKSLIDLGDVPIAEKEFIDVIIGKLTIDQIKFDYNKRKEELPEAIDAFTNGINENIYYHNGHAVDSAILSDATAAMLETRDELLSFPSEKQLSQVTTAISSLPKANVLGHGATL